MMRSISSVVIFMVLALSHAAKQEKMFTDAELRKIFNAHDCDGDGELSIPEAVALGKTFGTDPATSIEQLFNADTDHNNALSFSEYKTAINSGCCSITRVADAPKPCST